MELKKNLTIYFGMKESKNKKFQIFISIYIQFVLLYKKSFVFIIKL